MSLAERDQVVSALSSNTADDPFHAAVLPRASMTGNNLFDSKSVYSPKISVSIVKNKTRRLIVWELHSVPANDGLRLHYE